MIAAASAGAWVAFAVMVVAAAAWFVYLAVTWPKPRPLTLNQLIADLTDRIAARL